MPEIIRQPFPGGYDPKKDEEAIARRKREEREGSNPTTRGRRRTTGGKSKVERIGIPGYMSLDEKLRELILLAASNYIWEFDSIPIVDQSPTTNMREREFEWSTYKNEYLIPELEGRGFNQLQRELLDDYEEYTGVKKKIIDYIKLARDGLVTQYRQRIRDYNRAHRIAERRPITQLERIHEEGHYVGDVPGKRRGRPRLTEAEKAQAKEYRESLSVERQAAAEVELDFWTRSTMPLEEGGLGLDEPMLEEEYKEMKLAEIKERQERGETTDALLEDLPEFIRRDIMAKKMKEFLEEVADSSSTDLQDPSLFSIDLGLYPELEVTEEEEEDEESE